MPIQLRIPLAAASGVFNDCMIVCRLLYHVTVLEAHYTDHIRVCVPGVSAWFPHYFFVFHVTVLKVFCQLKNISFG